MNRHLTREELIECIDDPSSITADTRNHLKSCTVCAAELDALRKLMTEISNLPEPDIDTELMEELATRIDDRLQSLRNTTVIPMTRQRRVPKWAAAIVLPIAAAALLFLIPQIERWSQQTTLSIPQESTDTELTQYQWQLIWDGLLDDMDEISLLSAASPESDDPVADLQHLSNDELERFLNLLEETEIG